MRTKNKTLGISLAEPNSKDFLEALMNNLNYCKLLLNLKENQCYSKLLNWILSYKPDEIDGKVVIPDLKQVYKWAGISYSHIGTDLRDIYYAIYDLNLNHPRKFKDENQKICVLSINFLGKQAYFRVGLDVIPRVGEKFVISFIKPAVGYDTFWINSVEHEIYDGKQLVIIKMTESNPNIK